MDFTSLSNYYVPVVVVACLVIGYIIKHSTVLTWVNNGDIPCILAVAGAVLNSVVGGLSVESVVYGAVMGLSATGLHQGFKNFVEGKSNTEEDE